MEGVSNMNRYSHKLMVAMRGRFGLNEDDLSRDGEIVEFIGKNPVEAVREFAAWKLGDPYWATLIAQLIKETGANLKDF